MTVHMLSEVREPDPDAEEALRRLQLMAEAGPPPAPQVVVKRIMPEKEVLQVMTAMGSLLTMRLMLLLAVIGAFILAWTAIGEPNELRIWILGVYSLVTVAPLALLSRRT
jgi:hypothetical protein